MPQIKVLPRDLRNKIAAGEVIERPASVVKEMIENAIDAGSTDMQIDVLYGGKRLMKISDNGTGMDREDAILCFERHATSKLSSEDDLFNIKTMGFRGEALPSIASVTKMKIITGQKGSPSGVSVELTGGEVREIKDSPSVGTTVEVRDLFFNTPARKKFLKSNSTELFHIIDTLTKEALSHWEIGFRLRSDNKEILSLPLASGPKERILQVYGEEFMKGLTEVYAEAEGIRMKSYVTKGDNFRNMKSHQFIFINRRPIRDQSVSHAVYAAYEGIIPHDKHPVFFLFLDINPAKVDVNVHPTKREVRFENKELVYRFINTSIREAVRSERAEYIKHFTEIPSVDFPRPHPGISSPPYPLPLAPYGDKVSENLEFPYRASLPFIYLGDTFIALSGIGGLTLIDHHAAHERVLYERFLRGINLNSHQLLFPRQVKLSHKEYTVILQNLHILRDFGIETDDFGHDAIIVRSLPDVLKDADIRGILSDIASCIIEGVAPDKSFKKALAARIACHSSVRGKEILKQEELSNLIADLEQTEHPDQCPHGRPTRIFISLDDLKKMFKRK
ncbi:MAG: DNA mismatch repair endonuclease MutL [Thermodesulfovibrionales bacterium]